MNPNLDNEESKAEVFFQELLPDSLRKSPLNKKLKQIRCKKINDMQLLMILAIIPCFYLFVLPNASENNLITSGDPEGAQAKQENDSTKTNRIKLTPTTEIIKENKQDISTKKPIKAAFSLDSKEEERQEKEEQQTTNDGRLKLKPAF